MSEAKVTEINIPYPEEGEAHLRLNVGACRLKVRPGGGEVLVSGTYEDPTGTLPLNITQDGSTVRITQGHSVVDWLGVFSGVPRFDLALGTARPYILTFEGGASENILDLGGLPLSRLVIRHGAGKLDIDFSAPNPHEMSLLEFSSGAGGMEIRNLANANFAEMRVDGGAASYRFDFGGSLRRNAHVRISTAVSSVEISVPATTAARIYPESLMGSLDVGDGFMKKEGAFWTEAALAGETPALAIHTNVALGALRLRVTAP